MTGDLDFINFWQWLILYLRQWLVLVDAQAVARALSAAIFAERARITLAAVTCKPNVAGAFPRVALSVPVTVHRTWLAIFTHGAFEIRLALAVWLRIDPSLAMVRACVALLTERWQGFTFSNRITAHRLLAFACAACKSFVAEAETMQAVPVYAIAVDLAVMFIAVASTPPADAYALATVTDAIITARLGAILDQRALEAAKPAFAFTPRPATTQIHNPRVSTTGTVSRSDLDVAVRSPPSFVAFALPNLERPNLQRRSLKDHRGDMDKYAISVRSAIATKVAAPS